MIQSSALLKVYDTELIVECPIENKDLVAERLTTVMKHAAEPDVKVPFKCDADICKSWYYNDYCDVLKEDFIKLISELGEEAAFDFIKSEHTEMLEEELREILLQKEEQ